MAIALIVVSLIAIGEALTILSMIQAIATLLARVRELQIALLQGGKDA